MAAKIFAPPFDAPEFDFKKGIKAMQDEETEFIEKVKEFVKQGTPDNDLVGEVIKFNVADGYAFYMIANTKPLELIHIPLGDAWGSEFAELLTLKKVKDMVEKERALRKLFK